MGLCTSRPDGNTKSATVLRTTPPSVSTKIGTAQSMPPREPKGSRVGAVYGDYDQFAAVMDYGGTARPMPMHLRVPKGGTDGADCK